MDSKIVLRIGPVPETNGSYVCVLKRDKDAALSCISSNGTLLVRPVSELKKNIEASYPGFLSSLKLIETT